MEHFISVEMWYCLYITYYSEKYVKTRIISIQLVHEKSENIGKNTCVYMILYTWCAFKQVKDLGVLF